MDKSIMLIDGMTIRMRRNNPSEPNTVPIVMLHGNLGSGLWYEQIIDRYSGNCAAPDLPNFGDSGRMDSWMIPDYSAWLGKIADELNWERFILLGHSFGGAVAMDFALSSPERVEQLILVDSSPVQGFVTPREHYPAIEAYRDNRDVLKKAIASIAPELSDEILLEKLVDDAQKMKSEAFIGHAEALAVADYRGRVNNYKGTVHVLRGDKDILISKDSALESADFFKASYYEIENCGHSPMVEKPDDFWNILLCVLGEND
ncbi:MULTISPECIES: alpha/beta fold hydrolase [unclassified Oceanispirochaeta]|uniref:alpha/beta fold hydrolase n=1 Tax=unclassified Oceanispirochaeta TaxID=2635722 RepID=UPI000E099818|nr:MULTISPECIES: alpha/beta hydrolase [unclassified Oceanispirochaeta]MBF9018148.1 alpha/beta hydrolase [Oceanispirochaeta sp. M2]NPD74612.1 alpha/beta hydrolase [Oceanispirochaeta sp. M1]RDG29563.1 alpha/beta hydrolase [Oceanispirochaeta sp. M1]